MINLNLEVDFDDIIDDIDDVIINQIPYAAYLALNDTVYRTSQDVRTKLMNPRYIQGGPVPFTKRGIRYRKAKNKRELFAQVYIPDEQWKYLMWLVRGGEKRWLRSRHGIGVPIQGNIRLNKYGNIPGRARKEKIWRDQLDLVVSGGIGPARKGLGKKQFIAKSKNGTVGLWERTPPKGRGKPKLLVLFSREAISYKRQLPFATVTAFYAQKNFKKMFPKRLDQVIRRETKRRM